MAKLYSKSLDRIYIWAVFSDQASVKIVKKSLIQVSYLGLIEVYPVIFKLPFDK